MSCSHSNFCQIFHVSTDRLKKIDHGAKNKKPFAAIALLKNNVIIVFVLLCLYQIIHTTVKNKKRGIAHERNYLGRWFWYTPITADKSHLKAIAADL